MHDRYEQILQFGGLTAVGSVHTPAAPAQQVLDRLIRGNCGYRNRQTNPAPITQSLRRSMAEQGQKPCAVILTCADSRVPPEHIFHAGLGELFVIRNAGNLMGYYSLGSVEYAVQHLNAPLVVVMGHTGCGAVHAAMHVHILEKPGMCVWLNGAICWPTWPMWVPAGRCAICMRLEKLILPQPCMISIQVMWIFCMDQQRRHPVCARLNREKLGNCWKTHGNWNR